jgi:hypothetical protein
MFDVNGSGCFASGINLETANFLLCIGGDTTDVTSSVDVSELPGTAGRYAALYDYGDLAAGTHFSLCGMWKTWRAITIRCASVLWCAQMKPLTTIPACPQFRSCMFPNLACLQLAPPIPVFGLLSATLLANAPTAYQHCVCKRYDNHGNRHHHGHNFCVAFHRASGLRSVNYMVALDRLYSG